MRPLFILPTLAIASLSFGLTIGDKAPALKVAAVVKGKTVDLTKGVHVVEFWATWCGPCKQSIPHLTELAEKYKGKADFTGVSVWENGSDQLDQVKKFVASMGSQMNYNVDFDGQSKFMANTWMAAAGQDGIPAAFLVKDGRILWIGHPMDGLDEAVGQVLNGKFDLAASKAKFNERIAEEAKQQETQKKMATLIQPYMDAMKAKDYPAALKALDVVETKMPELKSELVMARFEVMVLANSPELTDYAKKLTTGEYKDNSAMLNSLAWSILDPAGKMPNPNYDVALIFAKQAATASQMKDPEVLDTYALALYKTGDKKQALQIQTQAVEIMKANKSTDPAILKDLQGRLDMYKKDAS